MCQPSAIYNCTSTLRLMTQPVDRRKACPVDGRLPADLSAACAGLGPSPSCPAARIMAESGAVSFVGRYGAHCRVVGVGIRPAPRVRQAAGDSSISGTNNSSVCRADCGNWLFAERRQTQQVAGSDAKFPKATPNPYAFFVRRALVLV